ncbi:phosphatase PAP2 family protein [Flavobacterium sp. ANB]|uniref:phosphatase PAP2 family protein n=1 Tax=unclassified Flavobacterium TaxID=196869 RepID=UPI0012B7EE0E|nr:MULTISPECIES: phosphatase PAP2 family protein [unclassified Flavobacterium]MBF4516104.1 phosphatase PAP2 family protein [Flavobacterium sp. ANB]MTD72201.1 phosphatase PAP2 family protein [Flavobacterium sp. LC2016-13]
MLQKLNELDTQLFLFLNSKHNSFFDPIMYWASDKLFWIPFYLLIVILLIREYKKKSITILISIALLITLCDQIASHLIKNLVKRLRPSHEPILEGLIHLSKAGPGGQYGFVSSHSANAFGLATFLILLLPKKFNPLKWILGFWAVLVAYSRIYNGVHYPGDVIVAAIIGIVLAVIVFKILKVYISKYQSKN